jgi:dethiobiotin synthetase
VRRGVFVTGTNTGVGKTFVARGLVRALVRRGVNVAALKPVESGFAEAGAGGERSDAAALLRASGRPGLIEDVCAYRLAAPVSPHLAAARDGVRIDPERIDAMLRRAEGSSEFVIAEGAGGLLVPLSDDLLTADFVARLGYRLLIVAPNALGAIHAALATVEAARSRGIEVLGVVLNGTPAADFGNAAAIERFGRVRILGVFPTVTGADDALADAAAAHLDLDEISRSSRPPRSNPGSR